MLKQAIRVVVAGVLLGTSMMSFATQVKLGGVGSGIRIIGASVAAAGAAPTTLNGVSNAVDQVRVILTLPASSALNNKCSSNNTATGNALTATYTTVNPSVFTTAAHGFATAAPWTPIVFYATTVPTGLTAGTTYYAKWVSTTTFQVVTTSNATTGMLQVSAGAVGLTVTAVSGAASSALGAGYLVLTKPWSISTIAKDIVSQATSAALSGAEVMIYADDATCDIGAMYVL